VSPGDAALSLLSQSEQFTHSVISAAVTEIIDKNNRTTIADFVWFDAMLCHQFDGT